MKRSSSTKNCTMYKLFHCLIKQVSVLVSTWRGSFLKGASRQTLVLSLLPHYYVDFTADLIVVFGLHVLIILVHLFKMLSSLCSAVSNFLFRHDLQRFISVLYNWCIPRISHNISRLLFSSFSFQISLESVCFIFSVFKRVLRVGLSWLELGLTDDAINFISIFLCCCYICLAQNVITEAVTV